MQQAAFNNSALFIVTTFCGLKKMISSRLRRFFWTPPQFKLIGWFLTSALSLGDINATRCPIQIPHTDHKDDCTPF